VKYSLPFDFSIFIGSARPEVQLAVVSLIRAARTKVVSNFIVVAYGACPVRHVSVCPD
jgi:hypothetical protein